MRCIRPSFKCPLCSSDLTDCKTDDHDVWYISKCTNPKCDYWIDAYNLVKRGEKVLVV